MLGYKTILQERGKITPFSIRQKTQDLLCYMLIEIYWKKCDASGVRGLPHT